MKMNALECPSHGQDNIPTTQKTLHQMAGCQGVPTRKHSSTGSAPIGPLATAIPVPSSHPEAIRPPEPCQAPPRQSGQAATRRSAALLQRSDQRQLGLPLRTMPEA